MNTQYTNTARVAPTNGPIIGIHHQWEIVQLEQLEGEKERVEGEKERGEGERGGGRGGGREGGIDNCIEGIETMFAD